LVSIREGTVQDTNLQEKKGQKRSLTIHSDAVKGTTKEGVLDWNTDTGGKRKNKDLTGQRRKVGTACGSLAIGGGGGG